MIPSQELVMRVKDIVYHLNCFLCTTCNRPLTKGEQFGIKDQLIYCKMHYEIALASNPNSGQDGESTEPGSDTKGFFNGTGAAQKGRPRKRKIADPNLTIAMRGMPLGSTMGQLNIFLFYYH